MIYVMDWVCVVGGFECVVEDGEMFCVESFGVFDCVVFFDVCEDVVDCVFVVVELL